MLLTDGRTVRFSPIHTFETMLFTLMLCFAMLCSPCRSHSHCVIDGVPEHALQKLFCHRSQKKRASGTITPAKCVDIGAREVAWQGNYVLKLRIPVGDPDIL